MVRWICLSFAFACSDDQICSFSVYQRVGSKPLILSLLKLTPAYVDYFWRSVPRKIKMLILAIDQARLCWHIFSRGCPTWVAAASYKVCKKYLNCVKIQSNFAITGCCFACWKVRYWGTNLLWLFFSRELEKIHVWLFKGFRNNEVRLYFKCIPCINTVFYARMPCKLYGKRLLELLKRCENSFAHFAVFYTKRL